MINEVKFEDINFEEYQEGLHEPKGMTVGWENGYGYIVYLWEYGEIKSKAKFPGVLNKAMQREVHLASLGD